MSKSIHYKTASTELIDALKKLMSFSALNGFHLVGGTSLSLKFGHRISVDIDMFTDQEYGSVDFDNVLGELKNTFSIVQYEGWENNTPGNSCFIGESSNGLVKLDLFYTDAFVYPTEVIDGIRFASIKEVAAMKLDVIGRGGRKKDFWDLHLLLDYYEMEELLEYYILRYPYSFSQKELLAQMENFLIADDEPDPICLLGKYWELIKMDIEDTVDSYRL